MVKNYSKSHEFISHPIIVPACEIVPKLTVMIYNVRFYRKSANKVEQILKKFLKTMSDFTSFKCCYQCQISRSEAESLNLIFLGDEFRLEKEKLILKLK